MRHATTGWAGTLFLGDRWLVYDGPLAGTGLHAHHAAQVITAVAPFELVDGRGQRFETSCAVVPPDCEHAIHANGQLATIVYVEQRAPLDAPTDAEGWARTGQHLGSHASGITTMAEARRRVGVATQALESPHVVSDNLVEAAMAVGRAALPEVVRLADLARVVHLSPSRFAHRFSRAVGIPVRRWLLWERLRLAARSLASGSTITDAAHASGFADGSHLNRTFRRMFGVAPSDVAGIARWEVE